MSQRVVCVKLTLLEHKLCCDLCVFGTYLSVSDVLRAGILCVAENNRRPRAEMEAIQCQRIAHEPRNRRTGLLNFCELNPTITEAAKPAPTKSKRAPKSNKKGRVK